MAVSLCRDALVSCTLLSQRFLAALDRPQSFILHRSQWQCLANSYSLLLPDLNHVLDHAFPFMATSQQEPLFLKLLRPLQALHQAMQDGERCMQGCIPRSCSHSWLVDKALMLEASTDVVHHLHHFLWCYATILEQASQGAHADNMESGLMQQTRVLCEIWTHADEKDDLSARKDFMSKMKGQRDGETTQLVQFLLRKLSGAEDLEGVAPDVLPEYLWVDAESLKRNPEILGSGGYGKVHEAVWLGGRFAVKDFFYVEDNVVFGREAVIQARLRHPNVMPLLCCTKNVALRKCSLVMELMQHDLRVLMMQRLTAGISPPFSLLVAVGLMLQIAKGMEYLHSLHIMHRDLKSSNILVSFPNGACDSYESDICSHVHVKIADFGMSKAKMMSSMYTTKQIGATIWRAPEVFEEDEMDAGTTARYTNKADVYSFGLVCYEILTGKSPFEGIHVRKRVMGGERPTLPPYIPRALSSYIERCWHADPTVRPPFTQICRMLCYFKACIFLQAEHDGSVEMDWLSGPISPATCDHIDDMIQKLLQPLGTHMQPKILSILLEMYCCQLVLHERDGVENCSEDYGESTDRHAHSGSLMTQSSNVVAEVHLEHHINRSSFDKTSWKVKRHFTKWFKQLLGKEGTQHSRSGVRYKLGLVGDFSFKELRQATSNFSKVIGTGLIWKVYYGKLADGREIAVKAAAHRDVLRSGRHASDDYDSGLTQELRITSQLRHRNILPLLGWCQVQSNLLLVYEYMPNGTLASHIFAEDNKVLFGWQRRHKAIIELTSALKYLHQDLGPTPVVHRDVQVSNVLLDSEWNARLGSYGLALPLKNGDPPWHILAGTFGHIAPETATHGICSPATDAYSFGVTVLEIACGRSRQYKHYGYSGVRKWVWEWYQSGDLKEATDVQLENDVDEVEMKRLLLLGLSCTNLDPHMRPTIDEVLRVLAGVSKPPPIACTMQSYMSSKGDFVYSPVYSN